MHGFNHIKTGDVHYFSNPKLSFVLKLLPDGTGAFTLCEPDIPCRVVQFPAPSENLLGSIYQPHFDRLGYNVAWFANAAHELLHIWYCQRYDNHLSPNHGMLMGLGDIPIDQADDEEYIVTGLQVYANTRYIPESAAKMLPLKANFAPLLAREFHKWIEQCVARPVGEACTLANCLTNPERV
jgi:hypothetical protein